MRHYATEYKDTFRLNRAPTVVSNYTAWVWSNKMNTLIDDNIQHDIAIVFLIQIVITALEDLSGAAISFFTQHLRRCAWSCPPLCPTDFKIPPNNCRYDLVRMKWPQSRNVKSIGKCFRIRIFFLSKHRQTILQ